MRHPETQQSRSHGLNARVEKALTRRYFRHMFRKGRVVVPGGGRFEWTVEGGKKQPRYVSRKTNKTGLYGWPDELQARFLARGRGGFIIVTAGCHRNGNIHDPRPVSLKSSLSNYYAEIRCACYTAPHKIKFLGLFPMKNIGAYYHFLNWSTCRSVKSSTNREPGQANSISLQPASWRAYTSLDRV